MSLAVGEVRMPLCPLLLSKEELQQLEEAIEENYFYEFVVDDIPVRSFLGHVQETGFVPHSHQVFLWTHQNFTIYYNRDKVCTNLVLYDIMYTAYFVLYDIMYTAYFVLYDIIRYLLNCPVIISPQEP